MSVHGHSVRVAPGVRSEARRHPGAIALTAIALEALMFDLAALGIMAACFAVDLRRPLGAEPRLMSAADIFGLVISLLVLVYLVYALMRGEKL